MHFKGFARSACHARLFAGYRIVSLVLLFALVFTIANTIFSAKVSAFGENELALVNIGIPTAHALLRAYKRDRCMQQAFVQAVFGGYIMQQGFKMAPQVENGSAWKAWQAKFMVNLGASLAESAADEFVFRMDVGPFWVIACEDDVRIRPGINAVVAPIMYIADGSKFNWRQSLKLGTTAFSRPQSPDGTLLGTNALAYSNANAIITDGLGTHSGHEMVHAFQYRREAMFSPSLSGLFPEFDDLLQDKWIDDTSWTVSWGLQCFWADMHGKDRNFDIPMEKEAYYLEHKYLQHW